MKKISTLLWGGIFMLLTCKLAAQAGNGKVAGFGIDGDVLSNFNLLSTWDPTGSHDWFKNSNTTALGIIDTSGAAAAYTHLVAGENYVFDKGMSVPRYSVQDGYVVLDARYARDYFGFSGSSTNADFTAFSSGSKNGMNPSSFITSPAGTSVSDKCDIIDAYVHMRRNGSIVNGAASSHLMAIMAASTVSNNGNRFFDVEFYCAPISYNTTSGVFSNSGSAATGGHTAWAFNPEGSIKTFGDMDVAFSFSGNSFSELSVWIWVSLSDYNTVKPQGFDFVSNSFNGATPASVFGYAKIQAKSATSMQVWGAVNTSVTAAPAWGTCSGTLGSSSNNYHYRNYDIGQLGEAAVDLTALGIDPALVSGQNPCDPPFKRVVVKSRSSSSFTSALQDFAGPYVFLDAPVASAAITSPQVLTCKTTNVVLSPQNEQAGNFYQWSTSTGTILSNPNTGSITVNKPGKYFLRAAVYEGCSTSIDSVTVLIDTLSPKATASSTGFLYNDPSSSVSLLGGDPVASNTATPFGGSMGLTYSWTGPSGFSSAVQEPATSVEGDYTVTVTEIRNGCTSVASTTVLRINESVLAVQLENFGGNINNNKAMLNWTIANNENTDRFEVERSYDGRNFTTAAIIFHSQNTGREDYAFYEPVNNAGTIYFRLKMYDHAQVVSYSKLIALSANANEKALIIVNNPVANDLYFSFQSNSSQTALVKITDMSGRELINRTITAHRGSNNAGLPLTSVFTRGTYVIELLMQNERLLAKFLKQ